MYERIRELRRILGLTQAEFATLIGASKDTVASWETGRNRLSAGMARRIALVTGVYDGSLLKPSGPLLTDAVSRRPFTLEEFRRHQKTFWGAPDEKKISGHLARCSDALELLFRAAATANGEGGASRLPGVLDSFIQWCKETRTAFRLEKEIDAQLGQREVKVELTKSYGQWREMAKTDPKMARRMGFKDKAGKDEQETLTLSAAMFPVWMPGHSMGRKRVKAEGCGRRATG